MKWIIRHFEEIEVLVKKNVADTKSVLMDVIPALLKANQLFVSSLLQVALPLIISNNNLDKFFVNISLYVCSEKVDFTPNRQQ